MEKRYTVLRIIATVYKIIGALVGFIAILAALAFCALGFVGGAAAANVTRDAFGGLANGLIGGILISVITILYGGGIALTLYAAGEGISLLIALEENTRATMLALQQRTP